MQKNRGVGLQKPALCVWTWATAVETITIYAGVNGYDGDGDITKPQNLIAFKEYVMSQTEGRGVHFVMADGVSVVTLCPNVIQYCII